MFIKVNDLKFIKDFFPITLIGFHYHIISTLIDNIYENFISELISMEQSTFGKGRQIIKNPLMLNKIVGVDPSQEERNDYFKMLFEKANASIS